MLAQVASLLEDALALPAWFDAVVVSLLLIGLPLVIVLAWVFELTPEGLKRTADVPRDASVTPETGRKLDIGLIVAIVVLVAVIAANRFVGPAVSGTTATAATTAQGAVEIANSIAVLPFVDMSPEQDQGYFSDGISEELLNVLAQVPALRVAGRTSSFAFKHQNKDLREIGDILDVAYIVEGSIRKAGNKVRITAQLIKAEDGYHQWSNTYDRDLTDIFAVEDEIARAIVQEMSAVLPALAQPAGGIKPVARVDIGAYEAFLLAREKMTQIGTKAAYEEAVALLDDAIAKDADYAPALAWRSYAAAMLSDVPGSIGDTPAAEALPAIRDYAERAIAADPASPEAVFALGNYYGQLALSGDSRHLDKTIETLRRAVALRPNFPQAQNDLALFLDLAGNTAEALELLRKVLVNDPGLRDANLTYIAYLASMGQYEEAEAALGRWARIRPGNAQIGLERAQYLMVQGRLADAWRETLTLAGMSAEIGRSLAMVQVRIRTRLNDGQWILDHGITPLQKALGAILKRDLARAAELVDSDPLARQNESVALAGYVPAHYLAGDLGAIIAFYEAELKTPQDAMNAAAFCTCSPLPLVLALKDSGHPDFMPLLDAWKRDLDARRELYDRGPLWNSDRADVAALAGDFAAAKRWYSKAIDAGWRSPDFLSRDTRSFLPADPEFDALLARMSTLINAERQSLGMSPLDIT